MDNDGEILDGIIREIRERIADLPRTDTATWIKLNDRLLKALGMKARQRKGRKGKGFNLSDKA